MRDGGSVCEDPSSNVLLVEAGAGDRPDDSVGMTDLWGTRFDWAFNSTPQAGLGSVTVPIPRGRTLGGSSSINGSFHIRGHRSSYDSWARGGGRGMEL
jgi:choline dehydrogenase